MNWVSKMFKKKSLNQADKDFLEAYDAFVTGEKIFKESCSYTETGKNEITIKTNKEKELEALHFFDKSIKLGFDESKVFSMRGSILDSLEYYAEALEDYNNAILRKPKQWVADNYYRRSLIKNIVQDYEGALADLKEAIRISQFDNDDNKYSNKHYQKIGFKSASEYYKMDLPSAEMHVEFKKRHPSYKDDKLKEIKRR